MVMGRVAVRMEQQGIAKNKSTTCAFTPQESGIRKLAQEKVVRLRREIERRFLATGELELPAERRTRQTA